MAILQRNSGTFTGTSFNVAPASGAFGTGTVLVVAVLANTVVNTPSGWTQRTSSVVAMGLYSFDKPGAGESSIGFTCSSGSGEWFVWELSSGSSWVTGQAAQQASTSVNSYASPSITPSAGGRHILAVVGGNGDGSVRTVTAFSAGFTEFADLQVTTQDWTFAAAADLDVTADGSTAYSTTGTYSAGTSTRGAITLAYVNASAATTINVGDAGSGAEAATVAATTPLTDAASASQTITASAASALAETGTIAEAASVAAVTPLTDAASNSDAVTAVVAVALADTGSAVDGLDNGTGTAKPLADSAAAAEVLVVASAVALGDVAAAAQALTAAAAAALTDAAAAAETTAATATAALADTGTATQALAVAAAVGLGDSAAASDGATGADGSAASRTFGDGGTVRDWLHAKTLRPNSGTTPRPYSGITNRP